MSLCILGVNILVYPGGVPGHLGVHPVQPLPRTAHAPADDPGQGGHAVGRGDDLPAVVVLTNE